MAAAITTTTTTKALNLVFLMFDDLRPELSIYKQNHMITPNFERLASKSVVFDKAFAQISVCNPSRDSILTGLRPDTTGTYSFQSSYRPHLSLPLHLVRSNYQTATYGKIFHWEIDDRTVWNVEMYDNKWYEYQNNERGWMNSSTMPDKIRLDSEFNDYDFTTKAIDRLEKFLADKSKPFMISLGFKYPHLQYHVPYKYYEMYLNKTSAWKLSKKELRFPLSAPDVGYRCCAEPFYKYMIAEGSVNNPKEITMGDINMPFTDRMRDELMLGYCAAITFVDKQLGRILDVMDMNSAWDNTVVVATSDHGHHNGEKGIWYVSMSNIYICICKCVVTLYYYYYYC